VTLEQIAAEEAERQLKMKQLLFRLKNRAAASCYTIWKDFVHEAKIKVPRADCSEGGDRKTVYRQSLLQDPQKETW
jgi:hypothetical protein